MRIKHMYLKKSLTNYRKWKRRNMVLPLFSLSGNSKSGQSKYMLSPISNHNFSFLYLLKYSFEPFSQIAGLSCMYWINKSTSLWDRPSMLVDRAAEPSSVTTYIELFMLSSFAPGSGRDAGRSYRSMVRWWAGPHRAASVTLSICLGVVTARQNRPGVLRDHTAQ